MLPTLLLMTGVCAFTTPPIVIEQNETTLYESRTIANGTELLLDGRPETETYGKFFAWIRANVNPDQLTLLARQRKIFATSGYQEEVAKYDLILNHQAGKLRTTSCLEALLYDEHLARQKSVAAQTEFVALILTRGTDLKIYFGSGFEVSPPSLSKFENLLAADLVDGWRLHVLLHNHPFFFDNPAGDIAGTTIPSSPDVGTFLDYSRRYQLNEAWITNGLDSIVLKAAEFEMFRTTSF